MKLDCLCGNLKLWRARSWLYRRRLSYVSLSQFLALLQSLLTNSLGSVMKRTHYFQMPKIYVSEDGSIKLTWRFFAMSFFLSPGIESGSPSGNSRCRKLELGGRTSLSILACKKRLSKFKTMEACCRRSDMFLVFFKVRNPKPLRSVFRQ